MNIMQLVDDGTLDTVVACCVCGREYRYTFAAEINYDTYEEFVSYAIDDATEHHNTYQALYGKCIKLPLDEPRLMS